MWVQLGWDGTSPKTLRIRATAAPNQSGMMERRLSQGDEQSSTVCNDESARVGHEKSSVHCSPILALHTDGFDLLLLASESLSPFYEVRVGPFVCYREYSVTDSS